MNKGVIRLVLENKLTKKTYRRMFLRDFLFGSKGSVVMLFLYALLWRVMYTITKIGQLKTNIPLFLGISFLLVLMLIYKCIVYRKYMKKDYLFQAGSQIEINEKQFIIKQPASMDSHAFPLEGLRKIKESKKWYFLYFQDQTFIPISKETEHIAEQVRGYVKGYKPVFPAFWKMAVVSCLLLTIVGAYYVGSNAMNFNGALAWKINEMRTGTKVNLEDNHFYTTKLDGIIDAVDAEMDLEPYLMTNDLEIKFTMDGSITSIYTYIYGYDQNQILKSGYLVTFDKTKDKKIKIHKQDWDGEGTTVYNPDNDLSIVINMLKSIPVEDEVKQWNEENNAVLYKGMRNWGYNIEGIHFIDENGKISIPSMPDSEIEGPTISLYIPGKEDDITPKRYVFIP